MENDHAGRLDIYNDLAYGFIRILNRPPMLPHDLDELRYEANATQPTAVKPTDKMFHHEKKRLP